MDGLKPIKLTLYGTLFRKIQQIKYSLSDTESIKSNIVAVSTIHDVEEKQDLQKQMIS
jgi:hypothetical protein